MYSGRLHSILHLIYSKRRACVNPLGFQILVSAQEELPDFGIREVDYIMKQTLMGRITIHCV